MSYFQTRFQGAPVSPTNALQAKQFLENMRQDEERRREKSKALAEDQKRLELLAQGFGLEKGETQSMSRGELAGFVEKRTQEIAQRKSEQAENLALQKFMAEQSYRQQDLQMRKEAGATQEKFADANLINAKTANQDQILKQSLANDARISQGTTANQIREMGSNPFLQSTQGEMMQNVMRQMPQANGKVIGSDQNIVDQFNKVQGAMLQKEVAQVKNPDEDALRLVHTAVGKEMAKDMVSYINEGGPAGTKGRVRELSKVLNALQSGEVVTGKLVTFMGETARKLMEDKSFEAQQQAGRIVAQELRKTLGAQFTAQEATDLLNRSFDPQMPTGTNIDRLTSVITESIERENSQLGLYNIMMDPSVKSPSDLVRLMRERNVFQSQANQFMPKQSTPSNNKTKLSSGNSATATRLDPTGSLGIVDINASE